MIKKRLLSCCFIVFTGLLPSTGSEARASALQATDLVLGVRFDREGWSSDPVTLAPDGARVAYVTVTPSLDNAAGRRQLWIQKINGGVATATEPALQDTADPAWSPDGKKLAFYAGDGKERKVGIYDVASSAVRILDIPVSARAEAPQWTPDSTRVLISTAFHAPAMTEATTPVTVLTSGADIRSRSRFNRSDCGSPIDLSLLDVTTGSATSIAKGLPAYHYWLSPNGTNVAYTICRGMINSDINNRVVFDIGVIGAHTASSTIVAKDIVTSYASLLSWSHDGSKLAFIGGTLRSDTELHDSADYFGNSVLPGKCVIVDARHPDTLHFIGDRKFDRLSLVVWSADDSTVYGVTTDSSEILNVPIATGISGVFYRPRGTIWKRFARPFDGAPLAIVEKLAYVQVKTPLGETQLVTVDPHSRQSSSVLQLPQQTAWLGFSSDGTRVVYKGQDMSRPEDVWVIDLPRKHRYQLTHLNPQIGSRTLGTEKIVSWRANGTHYNGILLLPAGYRASRRYPTICYVYAGIPAVRRDRTVFGGYGLDEAPYLNAQLFASNGYAVFMPDSTLRVGTPMREIAAAILPGLDTVVKMGIADPRRLGVMGQSYGGYSTLSLIVQTHRFKAAVAMAGLVDLISTYGTLFSDGSDQTELVEQGWGRIGGTPWKFLNRYIENSPFFYLNKIQTPTLLEYGSDDPIANFNMPEAFVALRRLGKEATLVRYSGDIHVLQSTSNQLDFTKRLLSWFARYL